MSHLGLLFVDARGQTTYYEGVNEVYPSPIGVAGTLFVRSSARNPVGTSMTEEMLKEQTGHDVIEVEMDGGVPCDTKGCFDKASGAINNGEFPYLAVGGYNSNSVVYTLMSTASIPPTKPPGTVTPGLYAMPIEVACS